MAGGKELLGIADFGLGLLDRIFGQQQLGEALKMFESLRGEGGIKDQLLGFRQEFLDQSQKRLDQFNQAQKFLTDFGQNRQSLAGFASSERDRILAGVKEREKTRQDILQERVDDTVSRAQGNFNLISQNLDDSIRSTEDRLNQTLADASFRFDTAIRDVKASAKEAIEGFIGQATSASEEAAAAAFANIKQTKLQIDQQLQAGQITPAQAQALKQQAELQGKNGLLKTVRSAQAADSVALANIRASFSSQVAQTQVAAARTLGELGVQGGLGLGQLQQGAEAIRTQAAKNLSDVEMTGNQMIDMGFQVMNNMIGQYDQSLSNNILTAMGQDQQFDMAIAGTLSNIEMESAKFGSNIDNVALQTAVNAVASDANVVNLEAAARLNWQQTIIPFQAVLGNAVNTYATLVQADAASSQPSNSSGLLGAGISGGFSLAGSVIGASILSCWVAAACFGSWSDPRTYAARFWISRVGPRWFRWLYERFGPVWASLVKRSHLVRRMTYPLMAAIARAGARALRKRRYLYG